MGWFFVVLAALFEVVGVIGLKKYSQQKTVLHTILFLGGFSASFLFLYTSFNYLQLSIAYSVWIGLGTVAAVLVNMMFFGESRNWLRLFSLAIIVIGVTGLKAIS
ncbi:QacE family quaternary ammonium compound efflux SMR transporter [Shouchella clausii]|jgi:paired small multidrug resistance pump|uniref:QacE family quaternary ammonium compound efflux SMR transporter n=1 Tax=Shouchella clausii (strain KSM-K16) TaxID=66692 RepID=Q5WKZ6_SHOC1|nr:multidrug efflux SMR transporter [Shouchella clausii]MCM3314373.1 multidrug efflux SMR transporter [Psychrobacillus sp. MER TA 17]KKI88267.1 multidrug resistance protein SMR [Shouchella clausii]MDO7268896.1 multidrug efflux SMR transporter [Shouchella clausii]MDO7288889.1 multidrug efflux SMR transporter [Shouchella clausii]PAD46632.1 QacE family quaternary ammonium compound efflux SMR transporter [Shouchella clausii]